MIEKNVIQSPFYQSLEGTFLELTAGLRPAHFIEDKTNYDQQKRDGLFTLFPRIEKQSARLIERRVQKRFTVGYIHRNSGLSKQQQRLSSKGCPTRSTIYAKNTERNSESHKDLKPSISRSYREGIKATIRGNFKHLENCESGAIRNNDSTNEEINFSDLEINLFCKSINIFKIFGFNRFYSFPVFTLSAFPTFDIMSISAVIKAQSSDKQKS